MLVRIRALSVLLVMFNLMAIGCGKVQEIAQTAGDAAKNAVDQASNSVKPADTPATPASSAPASAARTPSVDPEQFVKQFQAMNPSDISDADLAQLPGLGTASESIVSVSLAFNPKVSSAGLAHLAALPNLEKLDLRSSTVTSEGLASLKSLPHLAWLDPVSYTHLTLPTILRV